MLCEIHFVTLAVKDNQGFVVFLAKQWHDLHGILYRSTSRTVSDISNKKSKRWVDSSHFYNFGYIHTYFNIILTLLILKVWSSHHTHTWFRLSRNRHIHETTYYIILQYSIEGCVFALLAIFVFFFLRSLTVNVNEWFESL